MNTRMKKKNTIDLNRYRLIDLYDNEEYSLGGWLKENAGNLFQTVAGGVLTATGLGAEVGIPMMVSGGAGLLGNATADKPDVIDYSNQIRMPRTVGTKNMTPNVMSFKQGGNAKVGKVMKEFKEGKLHSGSKKGPVVKNRKQAIAIALSEAGLDKKANGGSLQRIEGPSHEQGGVQLMPNIEVEGGETIKNNVVNSDNWKITKQVAKIYNLRPSSVGKTPAEYSKLIDDEYKKNENMIGSKKDHEIELDKISAMSAEMADLIGNNNGVAKDGIRLPNIFIPSEVAAYRSSLPNRTWGFPQKGTRWNPYSGNTNNMNIGYMDFYRDTVDNSLPINKAYPIISRKIHTSIDELPRLNLASRTDNKVTTPTSGNIVRETPIKMSNMSPVVKDIVPRLNTAGQAGKSYDELFGDAYENIPEAVLPEVSTIGKNINLKNIGQTALGLAPVAVNAFLAAKTAAEGPDKVKLPRLHHDPVNPKLIDPAYQVQQAKDSFATANEAMSQISKKDYLRRRIQSATEEGKVTSGIRGQAAVTNAQLLNQAEQINKESMMRTDAANLEAAMQEENINAANKGAWQTSRDFYISNLGTMAGEIGRDLRLEDANELYNDRLFNVMNEGFKPQGYTWDRSGNLIKISNGVSIPSTLDVNTTATNPHYLNPSDAAYQGAEIEGYTNHLTNPYNVSRKRFLQSYYSNPKGLY